MEPTATLTVQVSGAGSRSAPITWGNRAIWQWHGVSDEADTASFENGSWFVLPPGTTMAGLTEAVERVLHRHEVLRAVFRLRCGDWWQVVQGAGSLAIDVYEAEGTDVVQLRQAAYRRLVEVPWSVQQWPMRAAVIALGNAPALLLLAFNRLAVDGHSVLTVGEDVIRLVDGEADKLPLPWQPIDEAEFERSADGLAINERALAYWRKMLTTTSPSMFDYPLQEPDDLRFRRLEMVSSAAAAAMWMLRQRLRVSPSVIILAAAAVVIGHYSGHSQVIMQTMAGNRMDRQRREMVGTLTSLGVLKLDLVGPSFAQLARRAFQASGQAHRFGYCDPDAVGLLRQELGLALGSYLDLSVMFNDIQTALGDDASAAQQGLTTQQLQELAAETVVNDGGGWPTSPTQLDVRLFLSPLNAPNTPLSLICDTAYVPVQAMRQLLSGIERVLISVALTEPAVTDLGEISGVTPVDRTATWHRQGEGWVDVAACQLTWQQVSGAGAAAHVLVDESGPSGTSLVGYLAAADSPDFRMLHRQFVSAIGGRSDVQAPRIYRWVAAAPPTRPHQPDGWLALPVLAEDSGRDTRDSVHAH
jgi:hypothetical protein